VRVAALHDVHGNLPALDAVLDDIDREGVDTIVSGGDVVWGPLPAECLERLRSANARFVRENADRDVVRGSYPIDVFARERLSTEQRDFVAGLPLLLELDLQPLGRVLFCHATPHADDDIVTRDTPDDAVAAAPADVDADVVVVGHTHVWFDRHVPGSPRLVNAGSVGMPYEGDPAARWLLLGSEIEHRRTEYDVAAAVELIHASTMPQVERLVENALRGGVSADEAVRLFESQRKG
jgi:putative phosphoesterase